MMKKPETLRGPGNNASLPGSVFLAILFKYSDAEEENELNGIQKK